MAKANMTKYTILGLLRHEPMSGYDIKKRVSGGMSFFYDLSFGQIYPMLRRLEANGLVTKRVEAQVAKPDRKVYRITTAGRTELDRWLKRPVETEIVRYELLLKLLFADQAPIAQSVAMLERFQARYETHLDAIEQFEGVLRSVLDQNPNHIFMLLTVLFGKYTFEAYLDWCDDALEILGEVNREESEP